MTRPKELNPQRTGRAARDLDTSLRQLVVGQEEAIQEIVNAYQTHVTGLTAPGRPITNLLFLGPTGSGKTRVVEATAESLLGDARALVKIDCAEFQHSHEIAKLIGSPPGYLGHRETHAALSQEAIGRYHTETDKISFVLFDEIEKASEALWNLLLGILDKATLTLGDNRKVDFSRAMIFMTSNLGAAEMNSLLNPKLGFAVAAGHSPGGVDEKVGDKVIQCGIDAARRKFTPEFINRLDKIVVFRPLGPRELRCILDIELSRVQLRILHALSDCPFVLSVTDAGKRFLLSEGTDAKYGARHLKRAIERLVVQPLSNLIATDQIHCGDWVQIDHPRESGQMIFLRNLENLPRQEVARLAAHPETFQLATFAETSLSEVRGSRTLHLSRA